MESGKNTLITTDQLLLTTKGASTPNEDDYFLRHDGTARQIEIPTTKRKQGYCVVLSDQSTAVTDKKNLEYVVATDEPVDFRNKSNIGIGEGAEAAFESEQDHLFDEVLYAPLNNRQQYFDGLKDGFRRYDSMYVFTSWNESYANDVANLVRSLGHFARVYFAWKGQRYWNVVISNDIREVVEVFKDQRHDFLDIDDVITSNYICL